MNHQELVKGFNNKLRINLSPEYRILDLISELGEISKELLKATNYGQDNIDLKNDEWQEELADVYYTFLSLANEANVDLDILINRCIDKYNHRLTYGKLGSGN